MKSMLSAMVTVLAAIMEYLCKHIGAAIEDRDPLGVVVNFGLLMGMV